MQHFLVCFFVTSAPMNGATKIKNRFPFWQFYNWCNELVHRLLGASDFVAPFVSATDSVAPSTNVLVLLKENPLGSDPNLQY
jgi:hypothetical protein